MKNILHIIDSVEPGGAEGVFIELILRLDKSKYNPVVTIPEAGWLSGELDKQGIDYHILPAKGSFSFKYLIGIFRLIRSNNIDLVQSHLFGSNFYASLAGFLSRTPVVSVFHGAVDISDSDKMLWLKSMLINLGSKKVIAVSESLTKNIQARTQINAGLLATIYNGVDTKRFKPGKNDELRNRYSLSSSATLVCSIGHMRPPKGYEVLLDSSALLVERGREVVFLIAGDGEGDYFSSLVEKRKDLKLEQRVIFLGNIPNPEEVLNGADVFLLPSISEGFSISTIEAMSCGIPVVATRSGGPEEIIDDGITGRLVPHSSPSAIADAICEVSESAIGNTMVEAALRKVRDRFSIEASIAQYEAVYSEIFADN